MFLVEKLSSPLPALKLGGFNCGLKIRNLWFSHSDFQGSLILLTADSIYLAHRPAPCALTHLCPRLCPSYLRVSGKQCQLFASIKANMAAKSLPHSSYFEQAAVKEFLLKTEEEKKELVSQNTQNTLQQSAEKESQERTT